MCLSDRKQLKIFGVHSSSSYQQGHSVIVAVSINDLTIKKEAVFEASTNYFVSYNRHN